jgi:hypothetical protein
LRFILQAVRRACDVHVAARLERTDQPRGLPQPSMLLGCMRRPRANLAIRHLRVVAGARLESQVCWL